MFYKDINKRDGLRNSCKECTNIKNKLRYMRDKEKIKNRNKEYVTRNSDKIKCRNKKWRASNRDRLNTKNIIYEKTRKLKDPVFKLKIHLRKQLRMALMKTRVYGIKSRLYSITGKLGVDLINYLHSTFESNYGMPREWIYGFQVEIDHIIPLATAATIEDVIKLNHYTNLQILLKEDNKIKGTKL